MKESSTQQTPTKVQVLQNWFKQHYTKQFLAGKTSSSLEFSSMTFSSPTRSGRSNSVMDLKIREGVSASPRYQSPTVSRLGVVTAEDYVVGCSVCGTKAIEKISHTYNEHPPKVRPSNQPLVCEECSEDSGAFTKVIKKVRSPTSEDFREGKCITETRPLEAGEEQEELQEGDFEIEDCGGTADCVYYKEVYPAPKNSLTPLNYEESQLLKESLFHNSVAQKYVKEEQRKRVAVRRAEYANRVKGSSKAIIQNTYSDKPDDEPTPEELNWIKKSETNSPEKKKTNSISQKAGYITAKNKSASSPKSSIRSGRSSKLASTPRKSISSTPRSREDQTKNSEYTESEIASFRNSIKKNIIEKIAVRRSGRLQPVKSETDLRLSGFEKPSYLKKEEPKQEELKQEPERVKTEPDEDKSEMEFSHESRSISDFRDNKLKAGQVKSFEPVLSSKRGHEEGHIRVKGKNLTSQEEKEPKSPSPERFSPGLIDLFSKESSRLQSPYEKEPQEVQQPTISIKELPDAFQEEQVNESIKEIIDFPDPQDPQESPFKLEEVPMDDRVEIGSGDPSLRIENEEFPSIEESEVKYTEETPEQFSRLTWKSEGRTQSQEATPAESVEESKNQETGSSAENPENPEDSLRMRSVSEPINEHPAEYSQETQELLNYKKTAAYRQPSFGTAESLVVERSSSPSLSVQSGQKGLFKGFTTEEDSNAKRVQTECCQCQCESYKHVLENLGDEQVLKGLRLLGGFADFLEKHGTEYLDFIKR